MSDASGKDDKRALAEEWLRKAHLLSEALPFMQRYAGRTIVIKYGGNAMLDAEACKSFARDVVLLHHSGLRPVVVHGGAPQIKSMLDRLGIDSSFADGLRISDAQTVEIAEMVLSGKINKQLASCLNHVGGAGVGISGKDANLVRARKMQHSKDLGFVGEPEKIDPSVVVALLNEGMIPVVAPIGIDESGSTYNINADTMAGALAAALNATRLLLLTDVSGVLDEKGNLIEEMSLAQAGLLLDQDGIVEGGMIPKLKTAVKAVESGVEAAAILDGRVQHALLLELLTAHGAGTLVREGR